MRSTDSDRKGIAACSVYEFLNFFRMCVASLTCFYNNFVFNTLKCTEFSFNYYAVSVSVFNNLLGKSDVLFKRLGRCMPRIQPSVVSLSCVPV